MHCTAPRPPLSPVLVRTFPNCIGWNPCATRSSVTRHAGNLPHWHPEEHAQDVAHEVARAILIALLITALGDVPALAAAAKSLGTVILAEGAQLDNADASAGTSVFPGDELRTSQGGKLRLRLGAAQVYLLADSVATLEDASAVVLMKLTRGTAGFSTPGSQVVEIDTPQAVIRSNGRSSGRSNGHATGRSGDKELSHGEVTIAGPNELVVSSFRGAMDIDIDGGIYTITEGHAYRVVMEPQEPPGARIKEVRSIGNRRRSRAGFYAITGGGAAIAGYFAYTETPESASSVTKK